MEKAANHAKESSSFQWHAMLSGIESEKLVGIREVWNYLEYYRGNLVLESQKFESEKRLFESDRAAALKQIRLDLQSKYQSESESLVSKLDEASTLLKSRELKITHQSKYINLLEDKLKNDFGTELPIITEETNETLPESTNQNVSSDIAFEAAHLELQLLVEQKKNDKLFYENRISQLEADVIRLGQELDQSKVESVPVHQPECHVQTEKDVILPETLQIKEQDDYEELPSPVTEPFDVSKQLDTSDSSGLVTEDSTPNVTPPLDFSDANEEILHVIHTSSSQFTTTQVSYNKIIDKSSTLKSPQSAWIQTGLLETCNTNLQCLEAMLSFLKSGYKNAGLKKTVQDLMKKWVLLDAKIFLLLQKDLSKYPSVNATFGEINVT
ncbi:uncharacterized protein LOC116932596 [Daphnia magna]|uniref:uncharacterized protein LOC116932596 n=1 Tax=Daphnia magna TaxID=35525 RepID=UPI001E1BC956|nr:uncharacterized protein LOC116932596 [Daphnia magna]